MHLFININPDSRNILIAESIIISVQNYRYFGYFRREKIHAADIATEKTIIRYFPPFCGFDLTYNASTWVHKVAKLVPGLITTLYRKKNNDVSSDVSLADGNNRELTFLLL